MMNASYTFKIADYRAALRLHRRQKLSRRINHFAWFVLPPVLAALGAIAFIALDVRKWTKLAPAFVGIECALVWIAIYLPAWQFYSARKCVRRLFQDAGSDRTILLEVTDEGIRSIIPGVSEGKHFWREDMSLACDEKIALIYVAENRFIPIPAHALSELQMKELRTAFERNAVKK